MHIASTCLYVLFFVLFFSFFPINPTWYPSVPLGRIAQDLQMNLMLFLAIHETSNVVNKLFYQNGSTLNLICSRKVHQNSTAVKFPGPNFCGFLFVFFFLGISMKISGYYHARIPVNGNFTPTFKRGYTFAHGVLFQIFSWIFVNFE